MECLKADREDSFQFEIFFCRGFLSRKLSEKDVVREMVGNRFILIILGTLFEVILAQVTENAVYKMYISFIGVQKRKYSDR